MLRRFTSSSEEETTVAEVMVRVYEMVPSSMKSSTPGECVLSARCSVQRCKWGEGASTYQRKEVGGGRRDQQHATPHKTQNVPVMVTVAR